MEGKEIDGIIDDLESTLHKPEFIGKLDSFNKTFIEKFKGRKEEEKANFPFGTAMPQGPIVMDRQGHGCSVVHTVVYVPYFPPRAKEVYPFVNELRSDLEYWKERRRELSKILDNF
jgi:hypothetical protein